MLIDKNGAAIRTDEKNYNSFKTRKEEAFMMAAFTGHTTGRNENKYYCKCTIEK
jgi:hypothetical protein